MLRSSYVSIGENTHGFAKVVIGFFNSRSGATSGCGGITNANVKEKVITKEDMEKNMQQVTKAAPKGVKFPGINPPKDVGNANPAIPAPSKSGG